jgi:hypothetical protein
VAFFEPAAADLLLTRAEGRDGGAPHSELAAELQRPRAGFRVRGAGTPEVDGEYWDDRTVSRPTAEQLDVAPVPQFRNRRRGSTLLLRRHGPHWWLVSAPSALDGWETVTAERWEVGDEVWYYYNYSRSASPPGRGWCAPGLVLSQQNNSAPGDSSVITAQPLVITSDLLISQ